MMRRNSPRQQNSLNASWNEDNGEANVVARRPSTPSTLEEMKRIVMGDSVEDLLRSMRRQDFFVELNPAQHSTHLLEWTMQNREKEEEKAGVARRLVGNKRNRQNESMEHMFIETSEQSKTHYVSHYHDRQSKKQNSLPRNFSISVSTSTTTSDDETLQPIVGWQCFMKAGGERYLVEPPSPPLLTKTMHLLMSALEFNLTSAAEGTPFLVQVACGWCWIGGWQTHA